MAYLFNIDTYDLHVHISVGRWGTRCVLSSPNRLGEGGSRRIEDPPPPSRLHFGRWLGTTNLPWCGKREGSCLGLTRICAKPDPVDLRCQDQPSFHESSGVAMADYHCRQKSSMVVMAFFEQKKPPDSARNASISYYYSTKTTLLSVIKQSIND